MDAYKYIILPRKQLVELKMEYWLSTNVLSLHWWLMLFFLIAPWVIWWRLIDKRRIREIGLYGFFILFLSSIFDDIGSQLNLWAYPYILTPISQKFEPYDYSVLPVIYMLIYQKFKSWKSFVIVHIVSSVIFSFVLEPLTVYFNLYIMINWKHAYSFIIYPLMGMGCKLIINKLNKIESFDNG